MRLEKIIPFWLSASLASALAIGCALDETETEPGQGGAGGTAGKGANAGGTGGSSAGSSAVAGKGGGGSGGSGTGGSSAGKGGSGGSAGNMLGGSGGKGTGGNAGSASGAGGAAAGNGAGGTSAGDGGRAGTGAGGSSGTGGSASGSSGAGGGSGGGGSTGKGSMGCGKSGRPNGGVVTVTNEHIYNFPESYDGDTPFPLLIGFHAAGNPIDQIQKITNNSDFATNYVRAFPKSAGNEWVYNTDLQDVYAMYDELLETYCIDEDHIFATGHSSGAQMIVQILTHADAAERIKFNAVAPVAASNYGAITRAIPVMYIHGKMDSVRGNDGNDVVARFRTANGCGSTSMPYSEAASCNSGGTNVNPGCVSYEGCMEPTIWCSHNDPEYSNTNHGWPCFATKAMYDFFEAQP